MKKQRSTHQQTKLKERLSNYKTQLSDTRPAARDSIIKQSEVPLKELVAQARAPLEELLSKKASTSNITKEFTIFFSFTDALERATVIQFSANNLDAIWKRFADWQQRHFKSPPSARWLRVDWVTAVRPMPWEKCLKEIQSVKRNYFRYGIALDTNLRHAFLEQEINANAMLYLGAKSSKSGFNEKHFLRHGKNRYGNRFQLPKDPEQQVALFTTQAILVQSDKPYELLHGYSGGKEGRNTGRRIIEKLESTQVEDLIKYSSQFLTDQVNNEGRFVYGIHPCFDREIKTYNTLRHASTTYSMLEAWEVIQCGELKSAIDRSLDYLTNQLIRLYEQPNGDVLAYLQDANNEIKLGGNAVCLLALAKYTELTENATYLPLMEKLALGIQRMQNSKTGQFSHVLHADDLSVKEEFRIIYYDGEAAFGLMRLYGITKDERWLSTVEKAFEYFIEKEHWKIHDHWLSYCVNELTLYRPEERYYQFGIKNVAGHLDFVIGRITTFPTLLELMMAAHKMITRLQQSDEHRHLLEQIDLKKFYRALETRAHYLLNGFFWPEFAMYFQNPQRIVGSFFIRHHSFRVRIDDVEHYLSGYVAYLLHYLNKLPPPQTKAPHSYSISASTSRASQPKIFKPDVGLLMYPASPKNFPEANSIAREATARGLSIAYFSYKTTNSTDKIFSGYVYHNEKWTKSACYIPPIVDNAPPRNKDQEETLNHISSLSFTLCQNLGGKKVTADILSKNAAIRKNLIPSEKLSMENVDYMIEKHNKVILKPHRGQRGNNILLIEKINSKNYLVKTNHQSQQLYQEKMCKFVEEKEESAWWLQPYICSKDVNNEAFDIRIPLFRAEQGEWRIAKSYVRQGAGEVTSNLATGGKTQDAHGFLMANFSAGQATKILHNLESLAYSVVDTLQSHYDFTIDALGCDFGTDGEKIYLFEVNAYPGIKGCMQEAAVAKVQYYNFLKNLEHKRDKPLTNNTNVVSNKKEIIINRKPPKTPTVTKIKNNCALNPTTLDISTIENLLNNNGIITQGQNGITYATVAFDKKTLSSIPLGFPKLIVPKGVSSFFGGKVGVDIKDIKKEKGYILLIDKKFDNDNLKEESRIIVDSVFDTVVKLSNFKSSREPGKLISLTGTAGKTSTKRIIGSILKNFGKIGFNYANKSYFILRELFLPEKYDYRVFEISAQALNSSSNIVYPDIAVLTSVGEGHSEKYGNIRDIFELKSRIVTNIKPGGFAIIYREIPFFSEIVKKIRSDVTIITYGEASDSNYRLEKYNHDTGLVEAVLKGTPYKFVLPFTGKHNAINTIAALAVCESLGLDIKNCIPFIKEASLPNGRGNRVELSLPNAKINIVNDCYNANPLSMKSSIEAFSLHKNNSGRKILVLGDMKELGKQEIFHHESLSKLINTLGFDKVYLVGNNMAYLWPKLSPEIRGIAFTSYEQIYPSLIKELLDQDNVLFKSSNSIGLNKTVSLMIKKHGRQTSEESGHKNKPPL